MAVQERACRSLCRSDAVLFYSEESSPQPTCFDGLFTQLVHWACPNSCTCTISLHVPRRAIDALSLDQSTRRNDTCHLTKLNKASSKCMASLLMFAHAT
jgi:hypothetical protein